MDDLPSQLAAIQQLIATGHLDPARERAERVRDLVPSLPAARLLLSQIATLRGAVVEAERLLCTALVDFPQSTEVRQAYLNTLKIQRRESEGEQFLQKLLQAVPEHLQAALALAELQTERNDAEGAVRIYRQALACRPNSVDLLLGLAQALEDAGDKQEAEKNYRQALRIDPSRGFAIGALLELMGAEADDELLERGRSIMAGNKASDVARALVGYGMGKVSAARGEHDPAFFYWQQANAARRRETGSFDRGAMQQRVDQLITAFDQQYFSERAYWSYDDARPVFVVGMPRSGTTLIEQVLAAHPDVTAYGELPEMPVLARDASRMTGLPWPNAARSLTAEQLRALAFIYLGRLSRYGTLVGKRFVDKAPMNFFHVGLIAVLYRKAHIIWCRRDPRDVCISIYAENFGLNQRHATDLGDLGFYFRQHERLMQHWKQVLPGRIHEVEYEALIADPEAHIRTLVASVNLEWDDACMRFHDATRVVQTPSRWQVRRPLYKGSIGRWKHYEHYISPLIETLATDDEKL